ncbi:MAG: MarR family EPS-associated transcriptional regulator [Lamprobacter sp.]|uniref:MarR family EPS-associated transcriptional regulator n=1 Tax=Lamprobacter sp. TaxID=3100796 RepID=UPI002B263DC1|nr:MarR family EPS-associated transcriptional regulator [Lamprobacter sp.]MEA3643214.1 MarR family EPS-associated transcriptional regulator [Lamprobacter sp.]
MNDELQYHVLKHLQSNPQASQRELARALGISLGRTNHCVRAVIERGWVKAQNFRRSNNKLAYAYLLTPEGIEQKTRILARFLKRKEAEYQALQDELEQLTAEASAEGLLPASSRPGSPKPGQEPGNRASKASINC